MKHTGNIPFGSRQTDHSSLGIFSAGVERVTIDGSGNIGIGTASPSSTLDVSGNILISGGDSQISFYAGSQAGYRLYRNSTTMVLRSDGSIKEDAGSRYHINTNGSERLRVDSNGNVGIGTTGPTHKLDVAGTTRISSRLTLDSPDYNQHLNLRRGIYGADLILTGNRLDFSPTADTTQFQFLASVRTTNDLQVDGLSYSGAGFRNNTTNTGYNIFTRNSAAANYALYVQNVINDPNSVIARFAYGDVNANAGTQVLSIGGTYSSFTNTNVGIGTTTPSAKLTVIGSGENDGEIQINSYMGPTEFGILRFVGDGSTQEKYLIAYNSAHTSQANELSLKNTGGDITLHTGTAGGASERMRITDAGNVGIGITSPNAKFHLYDTNSTVGGAYTSPYLVQLSRSSSGGSPLATYFTKEQYTLGGTDSYSNSLGKQLHAYINSTGTATNFRNMMSRVHTTSTGAASIITHYATHLEASGTGTIDQWYGLSIGNGGGSAFQNANATINNTYGLYLASLTAGNQTNPAYAIYQQGTERVYLQGNVGIGVTSPTHKLQVAGTFKSVGINDSASAQAIFINGNGEVGIGVTNQTTALDVGGVFQFSTTSDLLQINNNTNTGGINLSGNNSRIYFGGNRAIEGAQDGTNLILGEGYSNVQIHSGATLVTNGSQNIGNNLTVSGRTDLQRDLRLRGTDASPNLGVVRMYVDSNDTLFIDAANDGNNRVEINSAGDLTVPGILTAQEFRTEYISQTIIFESGSTTFGDDADDVHTRNGSVIINKNHTGVLTGNRVDALVINNDQMSGTGPETRIKFQANSNPTATISTKVDSSGVGGGLSFEVAENPTTLTTRLKISKEGFIGMNTDPASNALLKLGLRNLNGDGILLENISNSNQVAKLYQDNGTEGILSLSNSGLEHVKIRSNGSSFFDGGTVGFGTQNPSTSHKVDIVGDLKVGGTGTGTGNYLEIIGFNQSNTVILRQFDSNSGLHSFRFETAVDGLFTFRNGGSNELVRFGAQRNYFAKNVGIGTVSAATSLDIVDEDPIIRLEDTVTGAYSLVSGNGGNITLSADEGSQDGGSHILFRTDTTDRMRIDSAGNIRFHNYGAGVLTTDSAGNVGVSTGYITQTAADTRYVNVTGDTMTGNLLPGTDSTLRLGSSTNRWVKVHTRGVTSEGNTLDLQGSAIKLYNGTNTAMTVASSGNVGIGTTSPSSRLEVRSDDTDGQIIITRASNPDQKLYLRSGIGSGEGRIASQYSLELKSGLGGDPNYDLTLATGTGEAMRIDAANNNIGIGTASPSYKLDVAGDARVGNYLRLSSVGTYIRNSASGALVLAGNSGYIETGWGARFSVRDSSGTAQVRLYGGGDSYINGGNVGINTTSPTYGLHVNANAYVNDLSISSAGDLTFIGNALIQTNNNSFILNADVNANGAGFISLRASNVERLKVTTTGAQVTGELSIQGPATVVQTANQIDGTPAGTSMEVFDGNNYIGAFLDYTVYNDGKEHMRSGTIQMVFNPTGEARFTDNSTTDIGDSSPAYFTVVSAAPNTEIKFVAPDSTWHIRYHVRYL